MSALNTSRTSARRLCLLVVMLGLLAPGAAVAQVTDEAAIAVIVVWTTPFEERTELRTISAASHETVLSNGNDHVVVANGNFAAADARLAAYEALGADPGTLVSVDAGTEGDPQYWLDLVSVEGTPYGAFTLARTVVSGVTLTLFMGPVTTFTDGIAQSQDVVQVDGEPLFEGVEPVGLQSLLEASLTQLGGDVAADDDTLEDDSATGTAGEDAQPSPDDSGLIGEGTYVSPQHGVTLTWTDEWILDPGFEEPVTSDVNFDVDQVYLTVNSPQWVWSTLATIGTQGLPFGDIFRSVSDQSYVTQFYGEAGELIVSRMGVNTDGYEVGAFIVRLKTPEGYDMVAYEEWRLTDDGRAAVQMQLLMLVDDVEPGLEASNDLQIDGSPVITLFTHDEILSVVQDATFLDGTSELTGLA